jgi:hypothetical protein
MIPRSGDGIRSRLFLQLALCTAFVVALGGSPASRTRLRSETCDSRNSVPTLRRGRMIR